MWLAIVTAIIWLFFTVCFVDYSSPLNNQEHLRALSHRHHSPYLAPPASEVGSARNAGTRSARMRKKEMGLAEKFIQSLLYS